MKRAQPAYDQADVERAYRDIGRELWVRLYALCCDRSLAMEALHEAFLRLLEQPKAEVEDICSWVYAVGRNWLVDAARKQRRSSRQAFDVEGLTAPFSEPSAQVMTRESIERLRAALSRMKPRDREVLVLKYSLEWSSRQIADLLHTSTSAVDMRLSRARKRIARVLSLSEVTDADR